MTTKVKAPFIEGGIVNAKREGKSRKVQLRISPNRTMESEKSRAWVGFSNYSELCQQKNVMRKREIVISREHVNRTTELYL